MDNLNMFVIFLMWSVFLNSAISINGHTQRLLLDNPQELESRLHQMESSIQSLTGKVVELTALVSEKDNIITKLNGTVTSLQSTVTSLQQTNQNQNLQIQSLQTKVNTKKPGCQTGSHQLTDLNGHANAKASVIHFNPSFAEVPQVVWGTTALDVDQTHNTRFGTAIQNITTTGFEIEAHTWADTGLYTISVQWMACPAQI